MKQLGRVVAISLLMGCGTSTSPPPASNGNPDGTSSVDAGSATATGTASTGMGGAGGITASSSETVAATTTGTGGGCSYPSGPYGNAVGQTLPKLAWAGYLNPTAVGLANQQPWVSYGSAQIYCDPKKGPYGFVTMFTYT